MNKEKQGRHEEWQREISDSHNFSLQRFTQVIPVLDSEMDLNLQKPNIKLWRVQDLTISPEWVGNAATFFGPHL